MMNDEKWTGVSFTVQKLFSDGLSEVLPHGVSSSVQRFLLRNDEKALS